VRVDIHLDVDIGVCKFDKVVYRAEDEETFRAALETCLQAKDMTVGIVGSSFDSLQRQTWPLYQTRYHNTSHEVVSSPS
jgi:hypothetical protein